MFKIKDVIFDMIYITITIIIIIINVKFVTFYIRWIYSFIIVISIAYHIS